MFFNNHQCFLSPVPHSRASKGATRAAFFATLVRHIEHTSRFQTIVFDTVETNIGDAYNATSGIFTAPTDGVYVFSATILSVPGHSASILYYKNHKNEVGFSFEPPSDKSVSAAKTIILELTRGDKVVLKIADLDDAILGNGYSTFTGFLLWATAPQEIIVGKIKQQHLLCHSSYCNLILYRLLQLQQ